jgi:hypothetical protein
VKLGGRVYNENTYIDVCDPSKIHLSTLIIVGFGILYPVYMDKAHIDLPAKLCAIASETKGVTIAWNQVLMMIEHKKMNKTKIKN